MTEYDLRPKCSNCRDSGAAVQVFAPPTDGTPYDFDKQGRIWAACYKCKGEGRGTWDEVPTLKMERTKK